MSRPSTVNEMLIVALARRFTANLTAQRLRSCCLLCRFLFNIIITLAAVTRCYGLICTSVTDF